jgi:3-oxo-5-alpha-steroid 4-dehydrogenase 1
MLTPSPTKFASLQWVTKWYGMGKTSKPSMFNLPGRWAWFFMEVPGFLTLLYCMRTLPVQLGLVALPWQNKLLGGLFVLHYLYRAVAFPFLQPSINEMHVLNASSALMFQLTNGVCIGSWLGGYGPVTQAQWAEQVSSTQFLGGVVVFCLGLAGNYFHDEHLRDIRRKARTKKENKSADAEKEHKTKRTYEIPQAGLFRYVFYPHYLCEWIEWIGFWMACGWGCAPARAFLVNEIMSMLPRAVNGAAWYRDYFGEEKTKGKKAIVPGIL